MVGDGENRCFMVFSSFCPALFSSSFLILKELKVYNDVSLSLSLLIKALKKSLLKTLGPPQKRQNGFRLEDPRPCDWLSWLPADHGSGPPNAGRPSQTPRAVFTVSLCSVFGFKRFLHVSPFNLLF